MELVSQANSVLSKNENVGFSRDEKLAVLHSYVEGSTGGKPMVVHGKSGVGKSWAMCKFIADLSEKHSNEKNVTVFYRLLGTSQHSSDAFSLINSLYLQYNAVLERGSVSPLQDWEQAKKWMLEGIIQWPKSLGKLVIVLDSIDQLTWANMALDNLDAWIPGLRSTSLPENIRVVISTLPEVTSDHGTVKPLLSKLTSFAVNTIELLPFDTSDKAKVIAGFEAMVSTSIQK
jgi:archaellum biogenesis ATPase FlaH